MRPATSTIMLPPPATARSTNAPTAVGYAPSSTKAAPKLTGAEQKRGNQVAPADQGQRRGRAQDATRAERCVKVAGPRLAEIEHVERQDDSEHVEGAERDALCNEEHDEQANGRGGRNGPEPGQNVCDRSLPDRPGAWTVAPCRSGAAGSGIRPRARQPAESAKTRPGLPNASRIPVSAGETSTAALSIQPMTTLKPVSSSVSSSQTGSEHGLRGPRDRDRRRRRGGEGIRKPWRSSPEQHDGSGAHRGGLSYVPSRQHSFRAPPIGEQAPYRGEERRGYQLDERDDARSRGASLLKRVDEHRDPDRELGRAEKPVSEHDPAEIAVPQSRADDRSRATHGLAYCAPCGTQRPTPSRCRRRRSSSRR